MKDTISKIATYALLIFALGLVGAYVAQGMLGGPDKLTPQAQSAYEATRKAYCETEKTLAHAKLMDYLHGFNDLSEEDVVRLNKKKRQSCDFQ